jgi:PA14 domain
MLISAPAVVTAGSSFVAQAWMRNDGSDTWTTAAGYKLGSQVPPDNLNWGLNRVPLPQPLPFPNTGTYPFIINATAPLTPGVYYFDWKMLQEGVTWFGTDCWTLITVNPVSCTSTNGNWPPGTNQMTGCFNNGQNFDGDTWKDAPTGPQGTAPVDNFTALDLTFDAADENGSCNSASGLCDAYSGRWQGNFNLSGGTYRFSGVNMDDGYRVYVDNVLVPGLNQWVDLAGSQTSSPIVLTPGQHLIRVDWYQNTGEAHVGFSWIQTAPPIINGACGTASHAYPNAATNYGADTFCTAGTPSPATPAFPAPGGSSAWACNGSGGTNASCSASRAPTPPSSPTNPPGGSAGSGSSCNAQSSCPGPGGNPPLGGGSFAGGGAPSCAFVRLEWADNSTNEDSFKLYKSASNSFATAGAAFKTITSTTQAAIGQVYGFDYNLAFDTTPYYYWVTAFSATAGESAPTAFSPASLSAFACTGSLLPSDKEITAVNGISISPAPQACNQVSSPLPSYLVPKLGDVLSFAINLCNAGSGTTTAISVTDSLINLRKVSNQSDFNAKYDGLALTLVNPASCSLASISPGQYCATGTAPNQQLIFNLKNDASYQILPGSSLNPTARVLRFDAQLDVPAGFSGLSPRFQNAAHVDYFNGIQSGSVDRFTPLQLFTIGKGIPIIQERP